MKQKWVFFIETLCIIENLLKYMCAKTYQNFERGLTKLLEK